MIVHIVFWRLHPHAAGRTKQENAREMKRRFEALRPLMPGLRRLDFGIDFAGTDQSSDVALYTEFDSREALEAYQVHPAHKEVAAFLADLRSERRVVDYEV
jgi:heme-degrading monooxygenase HmoA